MSEKRKFELKAGSEFIELIKLLKVEGVAQTGGHGKILIESGEIIVNGEVEQRKRKKLYPGDSVQVEGLEIIIE